MENSMWLGGYSGTSYKVLIDADILDEAMLNRGSFAQEAAKLFEAWNSQSICPYITDRGIDRIRYNYDELTANFFQSKFDGRIVTVSSLIKEKARCLNLSDYESAIEHVCATEMNFDAIVTLNPSNFSESFIPILTVSDLEQRILLEKTVRLELRTGDQLPQDWLQSKGISSTTWLNSFKLLRSKKAYSREQEESSPPIYISGSFSKIVILDCCYEIDVDVTDSSDDAIEADWVLTNLKSWLARMGMPLPPPGMPLPPSGITTSRFSNFASLDISTSSDIVVDPGRGEDEIDVDFTQSD